MALRKCTDRNRIWNGLLVNSCIKTLFCKLNFNLMAIAFLQVIIRGRRPLPATLFNTFFLIPFSSFSYSLIPSPPPTMKSLTLLPLQRNLNHTKPEFVLFLCYLCQKKNGEKKSELTFTHGEFFPAANCHLCHHYFLLGCCLSPT